MDIQLVNYVILLRSHLVLLSSSHFLWNDDFRLPLPTLFRRYFLPSLPRSNPNMRIIKGYSSRFADRMQSIPHFQPRSSRRTNFGLSDQEAYHQSDIDCITYRVIPRQVLMIQSTNIKDCFYTISFYKIKK
jgi:hypothetical protein